MAEAVAGNGAHRQNMRTVLKDFYMPRVREELNEDIVLWSRIEPSPESVSGRLCVVAVRTRRSEGHGATPTGFTNLPSPGRQGYERLSFLWGTYYFRVQVDGTLNAADRDMAGAFLDVWDAEITKIAEDMRSEFNRMAHMDGSGRLATVVSIAGKDIFVRHPFDLANQGDTLQYIREGMSVVLVDASVSTTNTPAFLVSSTVASQRHFYVGAVDESAKSFKLYHTEAEALTGAAATAITPTAAGDLTADLVGEDVIARCTWRQAGNPGTSSTDYIPYTGYVSNRAGQSTFLDYSGRLPNEFMGIAGIVSNSDVFDGFNASVVKTAALQGLSVASSAAWKANVLQNGGLKRSVSVNLLQRGIDISEIRGRDPISIGITSYGVRRSIIDMLIQNQRYQGEDVLNLRGGFRAISFDNYPIIKDKDACPGRLYWLAESTIGIAEARSFHFIEDDSGGIIRLVNGHNEWEAAGGMFAEVWTDRRNSNTVITDITEN